MFQRGRQLVAIGLAICAFVAGASAVRRLSVVDLMTQYEAGEFDRVVATLQDRNLNLEDVLH